MKKKKLKSISYLKRKADNLFSHWIRERDFHRCYTCHHFLPANKSQCGHYISRNHLALRYNEENCHCQCVACNVFKKGNMAVYAVCLQTQYGMGILQELDMLKNMPLPLPTRQFLNGIIQLYGDKK